VSLFAKDQGQCTTCGAALQTARLPEAIGTNGQTEIAFLDFPVRECVSGDERWEAYPDFNLEIIDQLFHNGALPFAQSGLLRRSRRCSRCSASLAEVQRRRETVTRSVQTRHCHFGFRVSQDMYTCPGCGFTQLEGARASDNSIVDAMVDAFERATIKRL
jgi:hypothetical protein